MRDWPAATACYNRALEIAPDFAAAKIGLAYLEVFRNGNPAAGRKILQNIPAGLDPDGCVALARWDLAMLERDYATAEKILTDSPLEDFPRAGDAPKTFYQGRIALARGDIESAQRYFAAARPDIEKRVRDDPDVAERHAQLGLLYAYMQRKEDAIRESRRAVELEPESQNAFHGALYGGQSGAGLCTRWRAGPGDHADRASPLHSRRGLSTRIFRITSRWPIFVCAGNGIRCEAIRVSRRSSPDRSRRQFIRIRFLLRPHATLWRLRDARRPCFEKIVALLAPKQN